MNKVRVKGWAEARSELVRLGSPEDCIAFDRAVAEGRKVSAIQLLRRFGIGIYDDGPVNRGTGDP